MFPAPATVVVGSLRTNMKMLAVAGLAAFAIELLFWLL